MQIYERGRRFIQTFSSSWERNFIDSEFYFENKYKQMLVNTFVGMENPKQRLPTKATNIGFPRTMMIP